MAYLATRAHSAWHRQQGWDVMTSLTTHSPSPSPRRARGAFNSRFGSYAPTTELQAKRRGTWYGAQIAGVAVVVTG